MNKNTKLIDSVAALITAAILSVLNLGFLLSDSTFVKMLPILAKYCAIAMICFAAVTVLSFLIPEKVRTHIGWLLIAIFGVVFYIVVKEQIGAQTDSAVFGEKAGSAVFADAVAGFNDQTFQAFDLPPVLKFIFSIAMMAALHYLGALIFRQKNARAEM